MDKQSTICKKKLAAEQNIKYVLYSCQCSACQLEDRLHDKIQVAEEELETKEIKIATINQIVAKIIADGDLREGDIDVPHTYQEEDDLGFYQQACSFLIHLIEENKRIKEK